MNQVLPFQVSTEVGNYSVEFENVGERRNQLSIALLEAMRTNKTVRSLVRAPEVARESEGLQAPHR